MNAENKDKESEIETTESKTTCTICKKSFRTRYHLSRHLQIHSGEKPFQCELCNKRFCQKTTLNIHLLKHSGLRQFKCRKCLQTFTQKGNLITHMKRVHHNLLWDDDAKPFNCSQCSCQFRKLASLNGHVTRVHSIVEENEGDEVRRVQRVLEQISALNEADVVEESKEVPEEQEIQLSSSSQQVIITLPETFVEITDFDGKKYRVEHRRENGRRVLLCPNCNKAFSRPSDLLRHRRIHADERPFACERCQAKFRTTNSLKAHQKTHEKPVTRVMNTPEQTRRQLTEIENQLKLPDTEPSEVYGVVYVLDQANLVGNEQQIVYLESAILNESSVIYKQVDEPIIPLENSHHSSSNDMKPEIVAKTPKEFTNLTHLVDNQLKSEVKLKNLTITHKKVQDPSKTTIEKSPKKSYLCQYCSKSFQRRSDLQRHVRIHTNEKPFKCLECDQSFTLKSTLTYHASTHQKDRTTIPCPICSKLFTSSWSLKVHKRIHSNALPYKCQFCDKRVRNPSNLRKHERVHLKLAEKFGKRPDEVQPRTTKFSQLLKYLEVEIPNDSLGRKDDFQVVVKVGASPSKERKAFKCPVLNCEKEFSKPSLLERHKLVHTKEKKFICDICQKGFNQKAAIGVHMISHTDKYQFPCGFCPAKFKYRSGVAWHHETCQKKPNIH